MLHFYSLYHIKEKCFSLFCSLVTNENIKSWFLYATSNKSFLEFSTAKTSVNNVICLSWRPQILIRNLIATMFLAVSYDYTVSFL